MNLIQIRKTINRYLANEATPDEKQMMDQWMDDLAEQETTIEVLPEQASEQIRQRLFQKIQAQTQPVARVVSLRNWLRVAAVVVPVLVGSVFLWMTLHKSAPMLTFQTQIGETQTLTLPDGSTVFLKPQSVCSYPETFGDTREVTLQGVAFFNVQKNPQKKFIVHAKEAQIEVLGTSFEVSALPKLSQLSVTVRTGKVKVATAQRQLAVLLPNQKLDYQIETGQATTRTVESTDELGQAGMLVFNQVSLEEMLATLEGYYPVHFQLKSQQPVMLSGSFMRHMTLEQIIGAINVLLERYQLQIVRQTAGRYLVQ